MKHINSCSDRSLSGSASMARTANAAGAPATRSKLVSRHTPSDARCPARSQRGGSPLALSGRPLTWLSMLLLLVCALLTQQAAAQEYALGFSDGCTELDVNGYGAYLDDSAPAGVQLDGDGYIIDAQYDANNAGASFTKPCYLVRFVDWSALYVGTEQQCTRIYQVRHAWHARRSCMSRRHASHAIVH